MLVSKPTKLGAPKRKFNPDVIAELVDIRIRDQVPWTDMPDRYMDLLPEDSTETKPDYRTLKTAMLNDLDGALMPTRVHKKMRTRLEEEFNQADLGAMLMTVLWSQYGEWHLYRNKYLKYMATAGLPDGEKGTPFTEKDRERLDELGDKVSSTLFKIMDIMRNVGVSNNSLMNLMVEVEGGPVAAQAGGKNDASVIEIQVKALEDVRETTLKMMQSINDRHKAENIGYYRPINEEVSDFEEE